MERQGVIYQAPSQPPQPQGPNGYVRSRTRGRPTGAKDRVGRLVRLNASQQPGMVLTQRDVSILEAVFQYRVMTSSQVEALLFPSATTHAQVRLRLKLLFQQGYIHRMEQLQRRSDGMKPFLYALDTRGAVELAALYGCTVQELDWRKRDRMVGQLHLAHLLVSNDIRIAITRSVLQHGFTLMRWYDEKILRRAHHDDLVTVTDARGATHTTTIIPDGFFQLAYSTLNTPSTSRVLHRCIEVDRATVTGRATNEHTRAWDKKVLAYLAWHKSGLYQARYRTQALGILTITISEERLRHLKTITEQAGARERFWFTCLGRLHGNDILTDPLWSVATTTHLRSLLR